jgi:FkbM family methyltransferase
MSGPTRAAFVYWLSRWAGKSGRVVAFEPQKDLARRLDKICGMTGLHNVTVEAKAVYSAPGLHELHIPVRHKPGASLNRPRLADEEIVTMGLATLTISGMQTAYPC